jgi:hypothetical protein
MRVITKKPIVEQLAALVLEADKAGKALEGVELTRAEVDQLVRELPFTAPSLYGWTDSEQLTLFGLPISIKM